MRDCIAGPHISTGDMLRQHIEAGDVIGQKTSGLLKSGKLVADELANQLVEERLAEHDCCAGIILDGYPRTLNQAGVLLGFMGKFHYRPAVVHLAVDYEKIVARLSGRRQCPVCGTLYSLRTNPPKVAGICDLDGTPLVTREDDRESVIRERLAQYEVQTRPILNFFREAGVPLFEIQASDAMPDQIASEICRWLAAEGLTNTGASVANVSVRP